MSASGAEVQVFLQQLSLLVRSGMPLPESLSGLASASRRRFADVLCSLARECAAGSGLAAAMARHPDVFNAETLRIVQMGETSGTLDSALSDAAMTARVNGRIVRMFRAALAYPLTVLYMLLLLIAFFSVICIPQFKQIYQELLEGEPLPSLTAAVIDFGDFCSENLTGTVIVMAVLAVFLFWLFSPGQRAGRFIMKLVIHMPLARRIGRSLNSARICFSLGSQLSHGVPGNDALHLAAAGIDDAALRDELNSCAARLERGESLAEALKQSTGLPHLIAPTVAFGEEGAVPARLNELGTIYLDESEVGIRSVEQLWSIFFMFAAATLLGLFVLAMFFPMVKIVEHMA